MPATESSAISVYLPAIIGLVGVVIGGIITFGVQFVLMSRRITADVALAQQKFDLELKASRLKRKQELAEELLSGFYEFKDMMLYVRRPMNFSTEGKTRQHEQGESEAVSKARDNYFVQIERLNQNSEKMATFFSRQNRAMAWFGPNVSQPFDRVNAVLSETTSAANILVRTADQENLQQEFVNSMHAKIWWTDEATDPLILRLGAANAEIEAICRPILSEPE